MKPVVQEGTRAGRPTELYLMMNELYGIINSVLAPYEQRGFNAHQRTQHIVEGVAIQCEDWIRLQQSVPLNATSDQKVKE